MNNTPPNSCFWNLASFFTCIFFKLSNLQWKNVLLFYNHLRIILGSKCKNLKNHKAQTELCTSYKKKYIIKLIGWTVRVKFGKTGHFYRVSLYCLWPIFLKNYPKCFNYLDILGGPKKCTQILIYNFLSTIGFYCAEFYALNIHSIWNFFLNFVRDYFSKQLNMGCYRRLVIFTLFKIDVKITKISFCCCFHCDFQLVFYLSFLLFFS